jgi:hypothetical protein
VFSDELQDVIDSLLGQACPDWTPPPRVDPAEDDADQRRYHRIEVTRRRLGRALAGQPDLTARLSATIFEAVLLEHSVSDRLTAPLITAVGRRAVLEQLTGAVSEDRASGGRTLPTGLTGSGAGGTRRNVSCSGPPMQRVPDPPRSSAATWHVTCRHVPAELTGSRIYGPGSGRRA